MADFERIRDVISGPFDSEVIRQRTAGGWQMVSIEWRRELPDSESPVSGGYSEDIPYGLRISDDCQRLEVDPVENRTLDADDGVAGAGLPLFKHCQRPE